MMTAYGEPNLTSTARDAGAYSVIDKPFELAQLDPLLREAVVSQAWIDRGSVSGRRET
jgi:AmiR/NasT family two-component response regulator